MSSKLEAVIGEFYAKVTPEAFNSRHGTEAVPSPNVPVGLELEIEGWQWDRRHPGFTFTEDGSLRNNGIEAVSLPVRLMHAPGLLRSFFHAFPVTAENYSDRCSTHVHMNVLDLTFEQLATLCLLYQTIERLLFGFVGQDRDKNIFCVPWSQSGMNYRFVSEMAYDAHYVCRRWQKYTALNLQPVTTQGSVEFRHLHGTNDVTLITNWLRILGRMREYAVANRLEKVTEAIKSMNTVSNYGQWLEDVFQQDVGLLRFDGFEKQLSLGVVDTKFMLIQPEKPKVKPKAEKYISSFAWVEPELTAADPQGPRRPARNRGDYWNWQGVPTLVPGEEEVVVDSTTDMGDAQRWITEIQGTSNRNLVSRDGRYYLVEIRQRDLTDEEIEAARQRIRERLQATVARAGVEVRPALRRRDDGRLEATNAAPAPVFYPDAIIGLAAEEEF